MSPVSAVVKTAAHIQKVPIRNHRASTNEKYLSRDLVPINRYSNFLAMLKDGTVWWTKLF
jgi:hypothetical protein